jgi:hypothetical protein
MQRRDRVSQASPRTAAPVELALRREVDVRAAACERGELSLRPRRRRRIATVAAASGRATSQRCSMRQRSARIRSVRGVQTAMDVTRESPHSASRSPNDLHNRRWAVDSPPSLIVVMACRPPAGAVPRRVSGSEAPATPTRPRETRPGPDSAGDRAHRRGRRCSCSSTGTWETGRQRGGDSSTGSPTSSRSSRRTLRGPVSTPCPATARTGLRREVQQAGRSSRRAIVNDADAGVEEQSSCNAGDAYQGAFGVREVTDDKAVR